MKDYITFQNNCQDLALSDYCPPSEVSELQNRFVDKKINSFRLVDFYKHFFPDNSDKIKRVEDCAQFLEFAHISMPSDSVEYSAKGKLYRANFCRERLCSMCNFRRSLKLCSNMFKILDDFNGKYAFLSLTLTIPNVKGGCVVSAIDNLMQGIKKLFHYKRVKNSVLGYFRSLEMTYNEVRDDYHPHYHFMIAVDKSYFVSKKYISSDEWLSLWRKAMNDDSIMAIDIHRLYLYTPKHIAQSPEEVKLASLEFCKYSVKDSDLINLNVMYNFYRAFRHRRLIDFQGVFRDAFNRLKLQDIEDDNADLIHIDDYNFDNEIVLLIIRYFFDYNSRTYVEAEREFKSIDDKPRKFLTYLKLSGLIANS